MNLLLGLLALRVPLALRLLVAGVVRLNKFDQRHLGGVALALLPKLVDAGVATVAVRELLDGFVEQLGDRRLVAHNAQGEAAKVNRILLFSLRRSLFGFSDDFLYEGAKRLGLGQRGLDPSVGDERGGHVGHHRTTMFNGDAQRGVVFIVTHCFVVLGSSRSAIRSQRGAAADGARAENYLGFLLQLEEALVELHTE